MSLIQVKQEGKRAEIILDRAPVNALNEALVEELDEALDQLAQDKNVRVIILRSSQSCFIAGADIKMMLDIQESQDTKRMLTYVKNLQNTLNKLENISKPTIALINGHAMGGGLEVALSCDFRVMTLGKARIGLPEVKLGMLPGAGGTQRLTRLIGESKAKELIYFGEQISAEKAYELGIVTAVVTEEDCLNEVYRIADRLANLAPIALKGIKQCIQSAGNSTLTEGLHQERIETEAVFTSDDSRIGFQAFLHKKAPTFVGK